MLILYWCLPTWAQTPVQDSLHSVIDSLPDPCQRIGPVFALAVSYYGLDPLAMQLAGEEALELAESCHDSSMQIRCHNLLGVCFLDQTKYRDALTHFLASHDLAYHLKDTIALSKAFNNLGVIYWHQENYDQARQIYLKALSLLGKEGDSAARGRYYYNLGMIYHDHLHRSDSAAMYYRQALHIAIAMKDTAGLVDANNSLGMLCIDIQRPTEAEQYYRAAIDIARPQGRSDQLYYPLFNLSRLLTKQGKWKEAESLSREALDLAKQAVSFDMLQSSYRQLSQIDSAQGRMIEAFAAYQMHTRYLDSLRGQQHQKEVTEMQAGFELRESQRENERLRHSEQQKAEIIRTQHYSVLVSTILSSILAALLVALIILTRQRRDALEQVQATSEEKDALLGIVAHDLKAPLSNIREISLLLIETMEYDAENLHMLQMIRQETQRGEHLVRNLLDFDAIAQGKQRPEPRLFDLIPLVQGLSITYGSLARNKSIVLHWQTSIHSLQLYTDPDYISRIIDNLLTNALKFSASGKHIWLSIEPKQRHICIKVRDQGPGLSKEDQMRLFQRYERLANRPTKGESSSGLGLSIVKMLSDALEAEISVTSKLGEGSVFCLCLPWRHVVAPTRSQVLHRRLR